MLKFFRRGNTFVKSEIASHYDRKPDKYNCYWFDRLNTKK